MGVDTLPSLLMWHHDRWRCIYEPISESVGKLVVYSLEEPVLQLVKVSNGEAPARATALWALTRLATSRLSGRGADNAGTHPR